jgi:hypothetical protein
MAWLAEHLPKIPGSGIIYTLTVRDAEQLAEWLKSRGLKVEAYTSDTGDEREELERALSENRVKTLVATVALGMGFDKPDLAFVIHYQTPGSVSDRLELRFVQTLRKTQENQQQKLMKNSTMQARNVDGVFEVIPGAVLSGALLLLDDMIDSGWTLTVAVYQLRKAGSGRVYPLALASTSNQ